MKISKELYEKAKKCKSKEEAIKLLKDNGIELSDDELESAAGGSCLDVGTSPVVYDEDGNPVA